ncbi:MAG: hypothetical protein LBD46_01585 [Endomicrobium sp.]|nr:hypothetical protein [Endomicrobium sp.]
MNKIYGFDNFIKLFHEYVSNVHEEDKDLKVEVYNNAFVLPFRDSSKGVEINDEGGVFDSNCNIVGLYKTRKSISHIKVGYPLHYNFSSNTTYLNEDVVF